MPLVLCNTVYAVTSSEVQAAVDSQGKDAVAGNIFIWFLCAIAFLKISQKIDSFMSGLGVNVGHTGGSMMAEAMIVARSLGVGGKGMLNKGFGGGGSSTGGSSGEKGGLLSGGLAGVVGRNLNNSAMSAATDKGGGLFGKKAFESSLKSGGDLAKDVIGKVAKGDIAKTGSITGETADKALSAYLGYDSGAAMPDADASGSSAIPTEIGGIEESADSGTPVETASSAPGIGTPPESGAISDVPGASVPSIPETVKDGETAATAPDEIPMESAPDAAQSPEMPDIGYQPEIQPGMNTDMSAQSEISAADSEQADTVTTGADMGVQPETKIPISPDASEISGGGEDFMRLAEAYNVLLNSLQCLTPESILCQMEQKKFLVLIHSSYVRDAQIFPTDYFINEGDGLGDYDSAWEDYEESMVLGEYTASSAEQAIMFAAESENINPGKLIAYQIVN